MPWDCAVWAAGPSSGLAYLRVAATLDLPSTPGSFGHWYGHTAILSNSHSMRFLLPWSLGPFSRFTSTWSAPHYPVLDTLSGLPGSYPAAILLTHSVPGVLPSTSRQSIPRYVLSVSH